MDILKLEIKNQTIRQLLESCHVGRKKIYELFINKAITFNNELINYDKKVEGIINIDLSKVEKIDFIPNYEKLDIVYEDNDILIINKPAGIIIHPDSHEGINTLCNIVAGYYKYNNINRCIRYVHRLDTETTGIILFTKHFLAQSMLDYDLQNDKVLRTYLALCKGKITSGTINKAIGRDRHNNKMICYNKGMEAVTHYKCLKTNEKISLAHIKLDTGRTHQIRVHFQSINHPLLGDKLYGENHRYINRVALHSYSIKLIHPILKKEIEFYINPPKDMEEIINEI